MRCLDVGCAPNPGRREIAVIFAHSCLCHHDFADHGTNNEAEFLALLWARIDTSISILLQVSGGGKQPW